MVEDHHKDLEQFIAEEKSTGYPEFKAAVGKGEKVVKGHLEMANDMAKKLGLAPAPVPSAGM
jgi:adenylosuccinate lyase